MDKLFELTFEQAHDKKAEIQQEFQAIKLLLYYRSIMLH